MIALLLLFYPLLAGLTLLVTQPAQAKKLALYLAIPELLLTLFAYGQLRQVGGGVGIDCSFRWIESFGISFHLNLDGISYILVLLTNLLVPFIIAAGSKVEPHKSGVFYSLILFMQMALVGVFLAADGFLFYLFWELALIPIYFICLLWGGENRLRITFKFFVYTLAGSLLMLAALIYLQQHTVGVQHTFDIKALYKAGQSLSAKGQGFVFWCFFLAFAIKMPVFPFHTWQPDTYTTAPTQGTMLLSGIMLKMGTYGLIRWLLPMAPEGLKEWGTFAITLSIISILYASVLAMAQKDYKRLIAYSSIAHVGLIAAGILAGNFLGIQGGLVQMFSHGLTVVGLFYIAELISERMQTREIEKLGGIRNVAPQFALLFLIVLLGSIALPLTSGFVGEYLLMGGLFNWNPMYAAFAGISIILGAVYMLRSYQGVMLGETNGLTAGFKEITADEKWVLIPLVALVILLGVYPKPLQDISAPAIEQLLTLLP